MLFTPNEVSVLRIYLQWCVIHNQPMHPRALSLIVENYRENCKSNNNHLETLETTLTYFIQNNTLKYMFKEDESLSSTIYALRNFH
jgi:hypothetical protein